MLHLCTYLVPPTDLIMYDGGTASTDQVTATEVIRNGENFMFTCKAQDAHPGTAEVTWTLTNVGTFTDVETDPADGTLFDVVSTISATVVQSYCGQTLTCTATHTETSTTLTASTTLDVTYPCKLFKGNLHTKQKFGMFFENSQSQNYQHLFERFKGDYMLFLSYFVLDITFKRIY